MLYLKVGSHSLLYYLPTTLVAQPYSMKSFHFKLDDDVTDKFYAIQEYLQSKSDYGPNQKQTLQTIIKKVYQTISGRIQKETVSSNQQDTASNYDLT